MYQPIPLDKNIYRTYKRPEIVIEPKPWHWAPFLTLRLVILALGSARIGLAGPKIVSQLQLLRYLYFHFQSHEEYSRALGKGKRQIEHDDDHDESNKSAKSVDSSHMDKAGNTKGHCLNDHTQNLSDCQFPLEDCVLRPRFTTEEIVQRYKDVVPQ